MSKQYITPQDAAKQLGVTRTTVNNWIYADRIKSVKRYGRRLIDAASFRDFVATRNQAPVVTQDDPEVVTAVAIRPADGPANAFSFNGMQVRTVMMEGEPWWVAKDVCDVLAISNSRDALLTLDSDEKDTVAITDGTPGNPYQTIISEPGLYSLILRSRKPEAKAFKRWVTHEVLPTIRKTGGYGEPKPDALTELNRFAGMMNQLMPAVTGRINEISNELDALKAKLDPRDLATEAERIRTEREVELGQKRGTLSKLVGMIVDAALECDHLPPQLSFAKRYQGTWMAIHRSIGLNRLDDYKTAEQYDQAINNARDFLSGVKADGRPPMRLL